MDDKPPFPHAFPSAASASAAPGGPHLREPRSLDAGQALAWWSEGWKIFMTAPLVWVLIALAVGAAAWLLMMVPFFGALAVNVLVPVIAGGLALGCRKLARGQPLEFADAFSAFGGPRFGPLALIGVFAVLANLAVTAVLGTILFALVGGAGLTAMFAGTASQSGIAALMAMGLGALVLVPIAVVAFALISMATWLAPALVALDGLATIDAIKASFRGCTRNLATMIVYALVFIALVVVASIPFGLGLIVFAPVAAGSWFAAWRTIYGD